MSFNNHDNRNRQAGRRGSGGFDKNKRNEFSGEHSSIRGEIQKALNKNNTKEIIKMAKEIIRSPASKVHYVKTNQIRRIYGPVVKIQSQLSPQDSNKWERELLMLKPRVVYAAARETNLKELKTHIMAFIDIIEEKSSDTKKKREWTQHFCHFMEAVVAYHKEKEESKKSQKKSGQTSNFKPRRGA